MTESRRHSARVPEIELMKAIAIIGMVFVHVFEASWDSMTNIESGAGAFMKWLIEFLGCIPSAGAFTFAMGWGAAFTAGAAPRHYLKRALKLFLWAFYVNFMYGMLARLLDPEWFGRLSEAPFIIVGWNIYSLATVSMLYFALIRRLPNAGIRVGVSAVLAAAIAGISIAVPGEAFSTGNPWLDTLLGAFIRLNEYSWFPIVPWMLFPMLGLGLGTLYRSWNDRRKFGFFALALGAAVMAVCLRMGGARITMFDPANMESSTEYYYPNFRNLLCGIGIILLELALCFGILTLSRGRLPSVLLDMSRNVTRIFLIHWLFVGPLFPLMHHVTSVWVNMLIAAAILAAAFALARLVEGMKARRRIA